MFLLKKVPKSACPSFSVVQKAGVRDWTLPKKYDVEYPPNERRRLKYIDKLPYMAAGPYQGEPPRKQTKRLVDLRGPEPTHNTLMHKQYGIQALGAGYMKWGHFDGIRLYVVRKMNDKTTFAIWRVDGPWKAVTKKGTGTRMGCGKGIINHYVTPVKTGRIIIEMGGDCEYAEVLPLLKRAAARLPFPARAVTHEMLQEEQEQEKQLEEKNINPFTFKYCLDNNFMGMKKWASKYDFMWYNKYR